MGGMKNRTLVLISIERPEVLADSDALVHEVVSSISFGRPTGMYAGEVTFRRKRVMAEPVSFKEWTDDEWIRVLREFLPGISVTVAEEVVGRWREEKANDTSA